MGQSKPGRWKYIAELIAACNCDWGCPCNFNAKPTNGYCNGTYGLNIKTGVADGVKLDGVKFVLAAKWPGPIHEGGGTAKILIDQNATEGQREKLEKLLEGKFGGSPWSIFAPTFDTWLETSYVPFEWTFDGSRSSYKAGSEVQASLDSMRNPVTGAEASAKILLPNGLVTKELEPTATKSFSVFTKGMKFAAPGKYGFFAIVDHGS